MYSRIAAIDFETANGNAASVCAVGISVMEDGAVEDKYYSLIRPEENVSYFHPGNIMIHGIRPEDVKDAPRYPEVFRHMMKELDGALVCAHNAGFDMKCLRTACLNCGIPVPQLRYFDTVRLSKKLFPSLEHHRLNDMCDYLGVDLDHHNALSDSYGCLMIVAHAMNLTGIYDAEEMLAGCGIPVIEL